MEDNVVAVLGPVCCYNGQLRDIVIDRARVLGRRQMVTKGDKEISQVSQYFAGNTLQIGRGAHLKLG